MTTVAVPDGYIYVEARANLSLGGTSVYWQQRIMLPADTPELAACLERGLVVEVQPDGTTKELPPPSPSTRCCGQR